MSLRKKLKACFKGRPRHEVIAALCISAESEAAFKEAVRLTYTPAERPSSAALRTVWQERPTEVNTTSYELL